MLVRISKNLLAIKVLADSIERKRHFGKRSRSSSESIALQQAIAQVKSSQSRVWAIFSPVVYRLHPEHAQTIADYLDSLRSLCSGKKLPMNLLNGIELPKIQFDMMNRSGEMDSGHHQLQEGEKQQEPKSDTASSAGFSPHKSYLSSREYFLLLASIYLSESIEQMEHTFGDELEVERLVRLLRPEITQMENASSNTYKIVHRNSPAPRHAWSWHVEFKA